MPGKFYNLDTDNTLGGENSSDTYIASQRAVRTFVDGEIESVNEKIDAIEIVDELAELQDVALSNTADGQALVYDEATGKWINHAISTDGAAWGNITGSLSAQTDLNTALGNKANKSHTHTSSQITDLTIPAKVSDLENDTGFITESALTNLVPNTRKINNKSLTADVTLSYSDVGALSASTSIPTVSDTYNASSSNAMSGKAVASAISGKQDNISDLATIRAGASAGATAVQPGDNVSSLTNDAGYLTSADISAVFVYKGTKATVEDLPATGNKKGDVWSVVEDGSEYVWDGSAWEYLGQTLDLSGYATKEDLNGYVPTTRKVNNKTLTGNITLSASDVGAHPTITSTAKLNSDLVTDANQTNKFVTASEKTTWNGKQDAIADLSTIRANASAGADAATTIATYGDIVSHSASEFQAAGDYAAEVHTHAITDVTDLSTTLAGKQATIDSSHKLSSDLVDDTNKTHKFVTSAQMSTWNGKQDAIADLSTIRSNASAGASAASTIAGYGDIVTHNASEFLTEHQDISGKQDKDTAVTHTKNTAAGNTITPVYVASDGKATALSYTIAKSVPSDAKFSDTTYTAGSGLSLSGTQFKHTNSITAGTAGQSTASSGSTLAVPYVTYDSEGHVTGKGTHTHTVTGFLTQHQDISGKANASEVYTKSEIDGKLTGAMTFKGTVSTASALPSSSNKTGDMYNVTDTGANYAWDGSAWDKLSENVDLSGLVPKTTKINNKQLTSDVTLTYSDVSAASASHTHTYSDVGAASSGHTHNYVPTSRKVNNKALTADVSLTYTDVSAASSSHTHSYSDVGAASASHSHTYSDVGAASSAHTHATNNITALTGYAIATQAAAIGTADSLNVALGKLQKSIDGKQASGSYVPTSRKVNNKQLTADVSLTYTDVSAASAGHTHTYGDVGAASASHTHTYSEVGAASSAHTHTYGDVGAASESHTHSNYVPTTRKVNNKTLTADISLTYSDVSAASSSHTHSNYVPTSRTVNSKALTGNITLSASDVGALASDTAIPSDTNDLTNGAGFITSSAIPTNVSAFNNDAGYLTSHQDISGKQDKDTAVTHTKNTAAGNTITPVYVASNGTATALSYTIAKSVPADAKFSDTTYTAGTGLTLSGTQFKHSNSITAGTAGQSTASSGSTLAVPYVTYDAQGHITAKGTHTHTVTGFLTSHQDISGKANISEMADVAFSGAYSDLSGTPTIPSTYSDVGAASASHTHSGYVPTSRKVAGKQLTGDVTLTYSDVSAASSGHTHSYSDVGAASSSHTHSNYVVNTRKVAGKALTADVTLTYTDVSAASSGHTHTYSDVGAASASHTHTYSDVGAASASHTHSGYVATSRKVAGHALTADVTISSSDIGDLSSTISSAISGKANTTETYTKSEIDGKLTGAMHFKGTKSSASALPSSGNTTGDMWNVTDTGANYAWDGTQWDKLSENIDLSGVVPTSRKINNKALTADVSLTYTDVSAASSGHTHTYSDVGAASSGHSHSGYVPTSRKVAGKALTADVSLTYSDVSAASAGHTHSYTYSDVGAASSAHTHTYSDVGAASSGHTHSTYVPTSRTINSKKLTANVTLTYSDVSAASASHTHTYSDVGAASDAHTHGTDKITALTSYAIATQAAAIATTDSLNVALGKLQKSIDGKQASGNYVPTSRKVAGKQLTGDVTLTYSDVSAASSGHTHTYSDVGAASSSHTHSGYVATSRKINNKQLTADVTLSYSDVGALSASTSIPSTYSDVGAASASHTHTYSDVGAASSGHTHAYVPTSRKVAGKQLTADVTLTYSDVSAASASHTHTYTDVGAASAGHTHSGYVATSRKVAGKALTADVTLTYSDVSAASAGHTHTYSDVGAASSGHTHSGYQSTATAVTHTQNTAVGSTIKPVYIASGGAATALSANIGNTITPMYMASGELKALSYTIAKSVPSDANFSNTTYTAGTDLSLSGTTFNHKGSGVTAGTAGTSAATSGSTLAVPYVTYNAQGHITAAGTHTHTIVCPNIATNKVTALTGYAIATQAAALATGDSLNTALGKLEYKANQAVSGTITVGQLAG